MDIPKPYYNVGVSGGTHGQMTGQMLAKIEEALPKEKPEEANRILTDHTASLHLVCTASGVDFLKKEGLSSSIQLVGDPMYDAFCYYSAQLDGSELEKPTGFDGVRVHLRGTGRYQNITLTLPVGLQSLHFYG